MPVLISANDPRGPAAVTLALQAEQTWQRIGAAWRIPSRSHAGASYVVTTETCQCADSRFRDRACAHILAARLIQELADESYAF
jgi:hypothetical protein